MLDGISASLSGINNAFQRLDVTANNIANEQTPGYQSVRANNVETATGGVGIGSLTQNQTPGAPLPDSAGLQGSNVDPTTEQVNLLLNKLQFEANLNALKAQNDVFGSLLDAVDRKR